jgi:hypothetical protein
VYSQRKKMMFEDVVIPIVPIKTLIEMKKKSDRPQDKADVFYLKKLLQSYLMKDRTSKKVRKAPLLYYKTKEEIEAYRKKPLALKLKWLEAQMEFFHKAMPANSKRIREKLKKVELK